MFLSTAPIINSLDTLFHLAAYDKLENKFVQLLQLLPQESTHIASALRRKNKKGNNPLHIAASVGNVKVCSLIIGISKSMINTYNNEGESPLFVAALHGRKEAFLYLHSECGPHEDYCIRKNGDTILHCAIAEEHFESDKRIIKSHLVMCLAELCYKILGLYGDLVDFTNGKRITPLHLLANKPSAFKSGNDLRWFENIFYNSIGGIEEQELINEAEKKHLRSQDILGGRHQGSNGALWDKLQLPPYYRTCFEFVKLVFQAVPSIFRKTTRKEADIENSVRPDDVTHAGAPEMVKKLRMMKVRNKWSILIMNELLKNTSMYRFSKDRPLLSSHVPMIHEHAKSEKVDEQSPYNVINAEFNLTEKYLRILSSLNKDHGKDTKEPVKSSQLVMPEQEEKKKKEDSDQSKATNAQDSTKKKKKKSRQKDIDLSELTPILVAAKNGITEIVKATLKRYPMAMYDVDKNQKNIVLLTAEYKQPCVYELLLSLKEEKSIIESIFDEVDNEGNSALHLAAKSKDFIWPVPGALSQMQWEIKCT
ncbi:hypothetical protein RGQ29_009084 [Quercus rubra]|uniref:Uncharacterized protein n=1 Tax=Quercus rubra TaxID=3512 RepID=A0AAN7E2W4_QUERU|nr:hypothetical protein RGQ29_009084 [Quercus rubra]